MIELRKPPVVTSGLYEMDANTYHADPCPVPSLNHSVAKVLHDQSPAHARLQHPRFGGRSREATKEMELGAVAHALLLGRGRAVTIVEADSFRTKEAQNQRAAAYAQGFTPILRKDFEVAQEMAVIAAEAMAQQYAVDGWLHETVAIAEDGETWLRCMVDALAPDLGLALDYKTSASAAPEAAAAAVRRYSATQAAFYSHILDRLDPGGKGRRHFVFMFQERTPPYAVTFHQLDPAAFEIAEKQMERARLQWALCVSLNQWPAYERGPHLIAPMPWEMDDEIQVQHEEAMAEHRKRMEAW